MPATECEYILSPIAARVSNAIALIAGIIVELRQRFAA